jgi:hypothetical protein
LAHTSEVIGRGVRDARVFFCFLVAGMVSPMSLFLHAVLSTYGVVLAHLHPNALLTLAIFQHLCEAYVGMHPLLALFCVLFEARLDASGTVSGYLTIRLRLSMVMRFIPLPSRDWEEWQAKWCFVRFMNKDDPVAHAEPMGAQKLSLPGPHRQKWPAWRLQWKGSRISDTSTSLPTTW